MIYLNKPYSDMASSKFDIRIYSKFYKGEGFFDYSKSINNIGHLLEWVLDEIETLYLESENILYRKSVDKICETNDIKNPKNIKKVSFGKISDYSNSDAPNKSKEDIRKSIDINANIVLSSQNIFFIIYHSKSDVEKLIISIAKRLNDEMSDFFIELNGVKHPSQNKNLNNGDLVNIEYMGEDMEEDMEEHFFNKIIFGPTGTGKSTLCNDFKIKNNIKDENLLRTTFYEEYSYYDFFGQYKPIVLRNADRILTVSPSNISVNESFEDIKIREHIITYQFVPGIFFKAIVKAKYNLIKNSEKVLLIIEEINRGNCSAIFGDMFQLLDRDLEGNSVYKLTLSDDIKRHIMDKFVDAGKNEKGTIDGIPSREFNEMMKDLLIDDKLYIPSNLIIMGTMNTSDQSLFPIDSAFKRRWNMQYCHINYKEKSLLDIKVGKTNILWLDILEKINDRILEETKSEDKQIGQWFIKPNINNNISEDDFKNKLISYLYFDVFKHFPKVFDSAYSNLMKRPFLEIVKVFLDDKN